MKNSPLPGWEAQQLLSPIFTAEPPIIHNTAVDAGVLCLLFPNKNGQLSTVFMKRTSHYGADKHKGQISLPGGRYEDSDKYLMRTAIRETNEEIGVDIQEDVIIGSLTSLYVFVSNFLIHPFIAYIDYYPQFIPDNNEVAALIEISLEELFSTQNKGNRNLPYGQKTISNSPYYNLKGEILWGATAMICSEIEEIYKNCQ